MDNLPSFTSDTHLRPYFTPTNELQSLLIINRVCERNTRAVIEYTFELLTRKDK